MNPTIALTVASLKMYYRNRQAIFWTLVLPLMFIVIFGLLDFGAFSTVNMGLVDEADTPASEILTELLERMEDSEGSDEGGVIDLSVGNRDAEMRALEDALESRLTREDEDANSWFVLGHLRTQLEIEASSDGLQLRKVVSEPTLIRKKGFLVHHGTTRSPIDVAAFIRAEREGRSLQAAADDTE